MKVRRKIIEINEELCNGCGQCITGCAEAALVLEDGKARLVAEKYCDGLGACLGECPTGALKIVERVSEDFDEEAVEALLKEKEAKSAAPEEMACGCAGSNIQSFIAKTPCQSANEPQAMAAAGSSALTHWPVQIRLVPPTAPFLQGADLLIAADCTPMAYANFHQDFITGKVVMMGCPKFDDQSSYVDKLAEIFATAQISSVTTVIMEVPCCGSMRGIVKEALKQSGKEIPAKEFVISTRGEIL
ncbi:MAG: 4Fe-4S ferredoxin [Desulfurivibrionaceae bacterium]|nr:4Fe-4S ferredoxin [Desulfurivibrionaceae bacterium]